MPLYRIKLCIARENSGKLSVRNEIILPGKFVTLDEILGQIERDISERLTNTLFFRSQRFGYDLVRYHNVAQDNTLLAYRVIIHESRNVELLARAIKPENIKGERTDQV
jgi:hypothetical protein